jgi:LysR family transcriptional regulator, regulator for metE and metH
MDVREGPRHLEVRHLRLVAAVADTGSVTRAARRLHLTQSALSHQLRDVETRLGTALFARTARRMVPTPAGERLLQTARRVLEELAGAERDLGAAAADAGVARVATECYTCYHWLPGVLREFRERWPRVELRIVPEVTADPVGALRADALDVAIVHRTPADEEGALRYTALFDDEMAVIVPPGHRLAEAPFVRPEELADEHLILYSTPHSESVVLARVLGPAGVTPRQLSRIQLTEAILELVQARLGVTVLSRWAVAPQLRAGTLVAVPLTASGFKRQWGAVTRRSEAEPAYLHDLLALLRQHLAAGPAVRAVPGAVLRAG